MKRRVVVTGLGAVTPIGNTVEEFWAGIRAGKVGIGEITRFDTTDYKVKVAAEVKDFVAKERMDFKAARRMEPFSQYAVAAALEAYEDSGLDISKEDPFRAGVIVGSGIGSLQEVEREYEKILSRGPSRVNPLMVPLMISNMAAGNISIQLGFKGKCTSVVTACATGTNCIGDALRAIQYGDADIMLAGGTESCICPTGVAGFTSLTALSTSTDPMRASIPFDKDRNGFVLGEGAGVVILEELEHALARGARIYGEVIGFATCGCGSGLSQSDASAILRCLELVCRDAGIAPEAIDYVSAHATATVQGDREEAAALRSFFGDRVPVSSLKGHLGHTLGASGSLELIAVLLMMERSELLPTLHLEHIAEDCSGVNLIREKQTQEIGVFLKNCFAFGGINATLLCSKWKRENCGKQVREDRL